MDPRNLVLAGTNVPALEGIRSAGAKSSPMFTNMGDHYEINAGSKKELMAQINNLLVNYQGKLAPKMASRREAAALIDEKRASLTAAYEDRQGDDFALLGEVLVDQIVETAERAGLTRTLLGLMQLGKGQDAKVPVRRRDVVAFMATSISKFTSQKIRAPYIYPPLFDIATHIIIEKKDIQSAPYDLLDAKYRDGLMALMVREDRMLRELLLTASTVFNDQVFFGSFNPASLAQLQNQVASFGLPAAFLTIASDLWQDIYSNSDFVNWFDPVHQHELILSGRIGQMLNMQVITDGFRYDTLQVLQPGEVFVTAAPQNVGALVEQIQPEATPVDLANQGRAARGWFIHGTEAMTVGNARGVAYGLKV